MSPELRGAIHHAQVEVESAALRIGGIDDTEMTKGQLRSIRSLERRLNDIANRLMVLGDE